MADGARGEPPAFPTISFLLGVLRRRWRLLCATAVCGLVAGLLFSLAFPPLHSATTILLLRHPAQSDASRAMLTDAELLKTRTVAQRAIDQLRLRESAREFAESYDALPLSDDVLRLTVRATSAREAIRRARAVAAAFLEFRREEFERQSLAVVSRLEQRQAELSRELTTVVESINNFSEPRAGDASPRELGDLLSRRAAISEQLGQLSQRIEAAVTDPAAVIERSRVVDPASDDERTPLRMFAANAAAGVVGGLALGAIWIVFQALTSDRVRRPEEVMITLGAPTVLTVGSLWGSLRTQRRRLLRHLAKPRRDIADAVQGVRRSFRSVELPPAVLVGCVEADGPGGLLVGALAAELANEGKSVLVVDLSHRRPLSKIFQVTGRKSSVVQLSNVRRSFRVAFSGLASADAEEERRLPEWRQRADVVLALAPLDPAVGVAHLPEWGPATVAVVTVGRSSRAGLQAASDTIRIARLALQCVVVAGADRTDGALAIPGAPVPAPSAEERGAWNS